MMTHPVQQTGLLCWPHDGVEKTGCWTNHWIEKVPLYIYIYIYIYWLGVSFSSK